MIAWRGLRRGRHDLGEQHRPVSGSQRSTCVDEARRGSTARFAGAASVVIAALAWYGVPAMAQQVTVTERSCTEAPRPPSDTEEWVHCGQSECSTGCSVVVYDGWTVITRDLLTGTEFTDPINCYWPYPSAEGWACFT
jgi:hypothetical protein